MEQAEHRYRLVRLMQLAYSGEKQPLMPTLGTGAHSGVVSSVIPSKKLKKKKCSTVLPSVVYLISWAQNQPGGVKY